MPWPSAALRILFLLLAATVGPPGVFAEGNVGCLFSDSLCLEKLEWCYNDYAFGKCLQANGDNDENDLFQYNLEREALHELSHELRRLFALGYRWSHAYTQCRLRAMLYATKNDFTFDDNACFHLVDQDLEGALKALEGQDQLEPQETAIVKFTPSVGNPHADFADEVYYPPVEDRTAAIRDIILPPNAVDIEMEDPYAPYEVVKRPWIPQMNAFADYKPDKKVLDDALEFLPDTHHILYIDENLINEDDRKQRAANLIQRLEQLNLNPADMQRYLSPNNFQKLLWLLGDAEEQERRRNEEDEFMQSLWSTYNGPERYGEEDLDEEDSPEPRIYIDEGEGDGHLMEEYGSGAQSQPEEIFRELKNEEVPLGNGGFMERNYETAESPYDKLSSLTRSAEKKDNKSPHNEMFTEGGVVRVPESQSAGMLTNMERNFWENNLGKLLERLDLGFKRPERLDVKKPGPPFDEQKIASDSSNELPESKSKNTILPSMMKKEPRGAHPNPSREIYDVDTDYVYVKFKNSLQRWSEGDIIISNITNLLNIEPTAISHGRVDRNEVTFKVGPNRQGLDSAQVAKKIDAIKERFKGLTGIEITAAGVGDKTKQESVITVRTEPPNQFYVALLMIGGVLLALLVAGILLMVIRRHIASKEKLSGLSRPDTEASKDYQDLCRARMATKGQPPTDTVHGRITSLSRESEQSPSSRSSTSSWSEEPALHNMDISTGHMVLSYMEDHLKNKDRLEQEWVALCAYVAEPCETTLALKKENVQKNRYPDVLPYDHSRVVLNELSNISGSDYINASSITDHDPRNPAYIATQGPLPHTAPDFWQLIWEQGAVVIVMLTRLTEGGAAMCHRYWPEEGSELYHIYEVHLVSEHIWCDDYLVRSFYLKNTRTGETRTVTQFHFLSWSEASVPASTKALLEFRRKVNKSYRGRSCPIVVHCSDGAGRTGTYCLIDMVLSRMAKGAKEIDIAATLEHLRDQRPRMVATKQQFEFVLTAVAEEVHAILKALPPQPVSTGQQQEKQ